MKRIGLIAVMATVVSLLSSCEVIEGIFKAGVWYYHCRSGGGIDYMVDFKIFWWQPSIILST
jgi:hypothetical protein